MGFGRTGSGVSRPGPGQPTGWRDGKPVILRFDDAVGPPFPANIQPVNLSWKRLETWQTYKQKASPSPIRPENIKSMQTGKFPIPVRKRFRPLEENFYLRSAQSCLFTWLPSLASLIFLSPQSNEPEHAKKKK